MYCRLQRPELNRGAVEFLVSGEYAGLHSEARQVQVFALDTSPMSVATGLLHTSLVEMREIVERMSCDGTTALVGVVTYTDELTFYVPSPRDCEAIRTLVCGGGTVNTAS
jgi:hypothetical protein